MDNICGWNISKQNAMNYILYIENVILANDIKDFRNNLNREYTTILEHVTYNEGREYYEYIKSNYPESLDLLNKFKQNDLVGNPQLYNYDNLYINPTTLRYSKISLDIKKMFGDLNDYNYIEIGGGYGGQVRSLSSLYRFKSITLFDIPCAAELQKRYLKEFNIDSSCLNVDDDFSVEKKSIVVSNYAWTELDSVTRQKYVDKVISKCEKGFFLVNDDYVENDPVVDYFTKLGKNINISKDFYTSSLITFDGDKNE